MNFQRSTRTRFNSTTTIPSLDSVGHTVRTFLNLDHGSQKERPQLSLTRSLTSIRQQSPSSHHVRNATAQTRDETGFFHHQQ